MVSDCGTLKFFRYSSAKYALDHDRPFITSRSDKKNPGQEKLNICYSPDGRSVLGKTVPEVLDTA